MVEETGDGGAWWEKIDHTDRRIAVNEDLDVPTPVFVEGLSVRIYEHHRQ